MCSNIQILDDILVEEDEIIEVTASFEQSEPGISLIRNTASTTITDNDCKGMDKLIFKWLYIPNLNIGASSNQK